MQSIPPFSRQLILWLVLIVALAACRSVPLEQEGVLVTPESWPEAGTVVQLPVVESPDATDPAPEQVPPDAGQPADGSGEVAEPPAEPQPEPPVVEAPAGRVTHVIQAGETVGLLAQRYGVSINALATHNGIQNVNRITAGDVLEIPTAEEAAALDGGTAGPAAEAPPPPAPAPGFDPNRFVNHTVRRGETLFSIGQAYGFTVEELAAYNNLADPRLIYAGDVLRIPTR